MFRRNRHLQGTYTILVKTQNNKQLYSNHTYQMYKF